MQTSTSPVLARDILLAIVADPQYASGSLTREFDLLSSTVQATVTATPFNTTDHE